MTLHLIFIEWVRSFRALPGVHGLATHTLATVKVKYWCFQACRICFLAARHHDERTQNVSDEGLISPFEKSCSSLHVSVLLPTYRSLLRRGGLGITLYTMERAR